MIIICFICYHLKSFRYVMLSIYFNYITLNINFITLHFDHLIKFQSSSEECYYSIWVHNKSKFNLINFCQSSCNE